MLCSTTLLSLACGFAFRLNHLAVQVAKELTYPLQLMLLIPLLNAGGIMLGAPVPVSLAALQAQFRAGAWATLQVFALATGGAIKFWRVPLQQPASTEPNGCVLAAAGSHCHRRRATVCEASRKSFHLLLHSYKTSRINKR